MSTVAEGARLPGSGTLSSARRSWVVRRLRPLRARIRRVLRLVIATLVLMLALEAAFLLLLAPRLHLTTVNVATELALSDAEVLAMAGLAGDEQFFSLDAAAIEARLEQSLLVRDAAVSMRFPDTLRLDLAARTAAAVLLAEEPDGSSRAALVDRDGLVFLAGATPWRHQDAADVPALSGLAADLLQPGAHLPEPVRGVLADLSALTASDPVLAALISEIRLVPIGAPSTAAPLGAEQAAAGFDLLLFPIGFDTVLRFGPELSGSRLAEALVLLDLMRTRSTDGAMARFAELDVRGASPVAVAGRSG
ncbi:MAG: FtsQ-type POTRA domain-containing protein [Spirochaetaceae bacterium]|nr:FtsQ-type POTRA domain-containing protein [Spirochaetaceae bacterium]